MEKELKKFALLRKPFPWPWGPEGDPPGPEIYSIIEKLAMDKLVRLVSLRMNFRREIQEAQLKFNQEVMQIQKKFEAEFMRILG